MHENEPIPVRAETELAGVRPDADSDAGTPVGRLAEDPREQPLAASEEGDQEDLQDKHEESTMIDVHAPHGGLHTWKDFWIHLGTITLGLLIAISLEQSVEWLHHLHQRHQLEEDLHAEAQKNLAIMDDDYRYYDLLMANITANRERVDAMREGHGKVKLSYIPFKNPHANGVGSKSPQASVWTTAKESELVALLPRDEAKFYDRVYRQFDLYTEFLTREREVADELGSFQVRFAPTPKVPSDPINPELSRMSPEQLDQEAVLLAKLWYADRGVRGRLDYFYGAESALLHGGASDEDIVSHMLHHPLTTLPAQSDAAVAEPSAKGTGKP